MDKTAKRLKQRRKQEAAVKKREFEDSIINRFSQICKEKGLPFKHSRDKILAAYRGVEVESIRQAMITSIACTLCTLHREYGFGKTRLYRMAVEFTVRIGNVGQAERQISQMSEELLLDVKLDCDSEFSDFKVPKSVKNYHEAVAVIQSVRNTIPIVMYSVYYQLGFKRKRMAKVYKKTCELIKRAILFSCLDAYLKELENVGLKIDERGRFIARGKAIEKEHNKYLKRTGGFKNGKNSIRNFS